MARYVLVGTRPSELVDVKVDLTFQYNTVARNGSYFNRQVSLKLVGEKLPRGRLWNENKERPLFVVLYFWSSEVPLRFLCGFVF